MTPPVGGPPAAPPKPALDPGQARLAARSLGDIPPYLPFNWRRRLLIVALAVSTAVFVVWALLDPPGGVQRPRALGAPLPPTVAPQRPCAPGQTQDCLGGHIQVLPMAAPPGRAAAAPDVPGRAPVAQDIPSRAPAAQDVPSRAPAAQDVPSRAPAAPGAASAPGR